MLCHFLFRFITLLFFRFLFEDTFLYLKNGLQANYCYIEGNTSCLFKLTTAENSL